MAGVAGTGKFSFFGIEVVGWGRWRFGEKSLCREGGAGRNLAGVEEELFFRKRVR